MEITLPLTRESFSYPLPATRYSPYLKGRAPFGVYAPHVIQLIFIVSIKLPSPLKIGGVPPLEGRGYDAISLDYDYIVA